MLLLILLLVLVVGRNFSRSGAKTTKMTAEMGEDVVAGAAAAVDFGVVLEVEVVAVRVDSEAAEDVGISAEGKCSLCFIYDWSEYYTRPECVFIRPKSRSKYPRAFAVVGWH